MKIIVKRRDVIWSYVAVIISMLANILILPFILRRLDDDSIGLYYVFASLGGISALFDFGFTTSFSRNIAYCWSGTKTLKNEGADKVEDGSVDYALFSKVLYTSRIIYTIVSTVALLLALTIGTIYIGSITTGFTGKEHIVAWVIYACAIFANLYYGYYSAYLRGVGAVNHASKNTSIARMIQVVASITMLLLGFGLIGVSIGYFLYGLSFRVLCKKDFYGYNDLGIKLKEVHSNNSLKDIIPIFSTIWHNAWREGIVSLSNYLLNQAGTVIASSFFSLYETGLYSLVVQLVSAIATISTTMYTTYQPSLQSAYARRDNQAQKKYMSSIVVTYIFIYLIGMIAVVWLGRPIIKWLKPTYKLSISMFIMVGFYQFLLKFRNCYTTYFSSTNRLIYMPAFLISAVICVIGSVILAQHSSLGIKGMIIAQIFSQIIYNAWHWAYLAHKELKLSILEMPKLAVESYTELFSKSK